MPFPESVQALIAARLDTLEPEAKSLLADAAVIGKVFWAGAIGAMGDRDPQAVTDDAAGAVAQGARASRHGSRRWRGRPSTRSGTSSPAMSPTTSSPAPRAPPGTSLPPRWIESKAPDRVEDLADVLAYHYATALELARAAGQTEQAAELEAPALRFLGLAGERALGLDTAAALASFERALALTPDGHPERAAALARFGEAALHAGRLAEAERGAGGGDRRVPSERRPSRRRPGDGARSARCCSGSGIRVAWELPAEAVALLEPLPPGPELVGALTELAARRGAAGPERGRRSTTPSRRSPWPQQLGLPRPARALGYRGLARSDLGDRGGLDDYPGGDHARHRRPDRDARSRILHNNLGDRSWRVEGPAAALEVLRAGIAFAQARGLTEMADTLTANTLETLVESGRARAGARRSRPSSPRALEASGDVLDLADVRAVQARILTLRGQAGQVGGHARLARNHQPRGRGRRLSSSSASQPPRSPAPHSDRHDQAAALLAEIEADPGGREIA